MSPAEILAALQWRYATKSFDPSKKIPADVWSALEDSLVLTPSSYGLQPWQFLVITDQATREALVPHSWGQRQVADCSHFVVFTVKSSITEADVDALIQRTVDVRGGSVEALEFYRNMIISDVIKGPRSANAVDWAKKQTYIALGQLMLSAALLGIDACPMEGFLPDKYDEILGLAEKGLTTAVALPLGYRSESDKYATLAKVRYPKSAVMTHIA